MARARGRILEARIGVELLGLADDAEERLPLPVGIDKDADIAVAGAIGAAVAREQPAVARLADRRREGAPAEVIGQHELRQRLEHRQLDGLPLAGTLALHERRQHHMDRIEPDDVVGHGQRRVARLGPAGLAQRCGNRGETLNQIVIGGPARIGAALAVADEAEMDQPGIGGADVLGSEPQPPHGGGAHIADEHVGACAKAQQHVAAARRLDVDHDAALVAIGLQIHWPHARIPHRAAVPHDVALGRLDLDDVGAVIRHDLRRIRAHEDRRHVDDADAGERSGGRRRGAFPAGFFLGHRGVLGWSVSPIACLERRRDPGVPA